MNKGELIDAIVAKADISKAKAGEALDAFMESVLPHVGSHQSTTAIII